MILSEQLVPAFIAALIREGVEPDAIESAVTAARNIRLGESITGGGDALIRTFAHAQAQRLREAAA